MRTDCMTCPVRDLRCDDCMVPVLLAMEPPTSAGPDPAALDDRERDRLEMLVVLGLVDPRDAAQARVETATSLRAVV